MFIDLFNKEIITQIDDNKIEIANFINNISSLNIKTDKNGFGIDFEPFTH